MQVAHSIYLQNKEVAKTRGPGPGSGSGSGCLYFFPLFLFQFLSLFSCTVVFEFPAYVLLFWWKSVINSKELSDATKVLKGHLTFFLEIGLRFFVVFLKSKLVFASI